jgi:hypothetical protein
MPGAPSPRRTRARFNLSQNAIEHEPIINAFVDGLAASLRRSLEDGWWVCNSKGIERKWDVISIGKRTWEQVEQDLRIALACDSHHMRDEVYFTVRAGASQKYTPEHRELENLLHEALGAVYRDADRTGEWWPHWWRWPDSEFRDWARRSVLETLAATNEENRAIRYFTAEIIRIARIIDSVVGEWLSR